ncbi:MAG: type II toxin-antitoxin system Phd/YefM family antitoxin [Rhodocyclaceae bacterium]|nr:type II toxin-antitoxin system Phd/YefM family antitoxin [Rhodocyclaceae bacterium]
MSAVSVTEFKAHCLDLIRQVEQQGTAFDLTRRGRIVARLVPSAPAERDTAPWLRLRGSGRLSAAPGESVLDAADFEAMQSASQ